MDSGDLTKLEMYKIGKDLLVVELSTLSQRTNFFFLAQSVFVGAIAFAFQNRFPYIFPFLMSALVIAGITLAILTYKSGKESSEAILRWRLIMKSYENQEGLWNQYEKQIIINIPATQVILDRVILRGH